MENDLQNQISHMQQFDIEAIKYIAVLMMAGLIVSLGQLMAYEEKITLRIAIGRALSSMVLATVSGVAVSFIPGIHPVAVWGLAAGMASLGTSGLEKIIHLKLKG